MIALALVVLVGINVLLSVGILLQRIEIEEQRDLIEGLRRHLARNDRPHVAVQDIDDRE